MTRLAACLAVGLLAFTGCAGVHAHKRAKYLKGELDAFRLEKPMDEVWQAARQLLAERGYPMVGADAKAVGQTAMNDLEQIFSPAQETHPGPPKSFLARVLGTSGSSATERSLDTGWRPSNDRYQVQGFEENGKCRVVFTRVRANTDRTQTAERDVELELELVTRVDPEAGARLDAGAEAASR